MTLVDLTVPTVRSSRLDGLPVAIIGAGPIGLAAAAHLIERGIPFEIYETGDASGHTVSQWAHIRFFSPWKMLVDPAAARLLAETGWASPDEKKLPTGGQFLDDYLAPLAALDSIRPHIRYGVTVTDVSREGMDRTRSTGRDDTPFLLRISDADGVREVTSRTLCRM